MSQATASRLSYQDALASLGTLTPELLGVPGQPRRKFSLDEIRILSAALGDPHRRFPSVLVAGTNGKGSTSATIASIARASGLRVGLYTSPHLTRVNERIRILLPADAEAMATVAPKSDEVGYLGDIPNQTFADLYFRVLLAAEKSVADGALAHLPSFFELLTAISFVYFAEEKVDLAVLEVGMGGRLDATNLVDPVLSVITDISLDHQEWLGETIGLIAREKAGILRPNGTLITLPQHPDANQALGEVAIRLNVRGIPATGYMPQSFDRAHENFSEPYPVPVMDTEILVDSPLKGAHQHRNLALAIASAVELRARHGFPITAATIAHGIRSTRWPGRLETVQPAWQTAAFPQWIVDVAHNPAGAWALRAALSSLDFPTPEESDNPSRARGNILIFGCLRDKPLLEMAQILFPTFDHVVLAPIHSPRATEVSDLVAAANATGTPATPTNTVAEALQSAANLHPRRIVVSGSVYLVGEARTLLLHPKAPIA